MSSKRANRLVVDAGVLSPTIWIGRLSADGTHFLEGKQDATDMVLRVVAAYAQRHFEGAVQANYSDFSVEIRVTKNGKTV